MTQHPESARFIALDTYDIRFPTSRTLDGSDAMNLDPDYSAAYLVLRTDSADALERLKARYRLGVITNCDDDLFARSNAKLGVAFDWVITAQQVGAYKPDPRNFAYAFERTVPSVPITPMWPLRVADSALCAPGSTAPITGTRVAATSAGRAFADAVLHAIRTSLTPRSSRNCWHASEYFSTVRGLLLP